ncbi:hypothetical protein [Streptomyces sp. KL116D]|uniref:hypothetical protein n=1 Tax=Streptomyces sp. KL116D TaxID=3045152 RepID=UPI00355928B9
MSVSTSALITWAAPFEALVVEGGLEHPALPSVVGARTRGEAVAESGPDLFVERSLAVEGP